jgi:integrase
MRGCRALDKNEIGLLKEANCRIFTRPIAERNWTMWMVMLTTGIRLGECRMLRVGDVSVGGHIADTVYLQSRFTKIKKGGNVIRLHPDTQAQLKRWLDFAGLQQRSDWLFPATKSGNSQVGHFKTTPITDRAARKLLARLVKDEMHLTGHVSTHSFRKTFARRMYELLGNDIMATSTALRHHELKSTLCYLSVDEDRVQDAIMQFFDSPAA